MSKISSFPEKGQTLMHISSSPRDAGIQQDAGAASQLFPPVTISERSLVVLALVRIFAGLLWFQQLFWKLPPDFAGLHRYVVEEGQYTFLPGYAYIIQHIFLPNFLLLGAFTWSAELLVAISLLFGVFTRFGALLYTPRAPTVRRTGLRAGGVVLDLWHACFNRDCAFCHPHRATPGGRPVACAQVGESREDAARCTSYCDGSPNR